MSKTFVVIPTYNERENLPILVERIFALNIPELELVVVDDHSPDGTGTVADELAKKYPMKVLHRDGKQGLGTAYITGFREVLSRAPTDSRIIQMDADLSHDPSAIPTLLHASENCDLVLGSRYIAGGKIERWGASRRLISKFGNIYARIILSLPYHDLTGGFKCFRQKTLEAIDFSLLSSVGYNFQIETTFLTHKKGFRICEVPITFTERKIGTSKFNWTIISESFWKVLLLRLRG
ncbi:MAG: polyprenol monophosphomannose synthase [bacterium]|nr:polyprenol monophosphomannose synthase [bacterium]